MPITQFLHVSIGVSDPEKSVPFYRDILGFKLIAEIRYDKRGPAKVMGFKEADFTVWLMMRDGFRLELIHFDHPKSEPLKERPRTNSLGVSHLTVGIEDPEKTMAELKARGVKVWDHTVGNFEENAPGFMFLFEDPDGFLIEAYMARPDGKFPYGNDSKPSSSRAQPSRQPSGQARRQAVNK
jgi:catechol 2,3-dioxygenase-like lactoylglutathione lyase family enzyme